MMSSLSQLNLDENYGVKTNALIDSCTTIIRRILLDKKEIWIQETSSDHQTFIAAHPNRAWRACNVQKFNSPDFEDFDLPLCVKWLAEFKWSPTEKLSPAKLQSLKALISLRHEFKHLPDINRVTQSDYAAHCQIVQGSLEHLGIDAGVIQEIRLTADNATIVHKDKVLNAIQTLKDNEWRFNTIDLLGCGCFGIVLKVQDQLDSSTTALKLVPSRQTNDTSADLRESRNLAALSDHRNVVKYKTSNFFELSREKFQDIIKWQSESWKSSAPDWVSACLFNSGTGTLLGCYIQTEVCGETLRQWLEKCCIEDVASDQHKKDICGDIMAALDFIHNGNPSNVIVHRDLRPDNIYFAKPGFKFPVKIGDFGLSNNINTYASATQTIQIGNMLYRAPEMDDPTPNADRAGKAKYGPGVDLFSTGLIVAEVFDPTPQNGLKKKFDAIRHKQNVGDLIRERYSMVGATVISLTDENPAKRHRLGTDGKYAPLEWSELAVQNVSKELGKNEEVIQRFSTMSINGSRSGSMVVVTETRTTAIYGLPFDSAIMRHAALPFPKTNFIPPPPQRLNELPDVVPMPASTRDASLNYDEIVGLRKILQREKRLWQPKQLAEFFTLVSGKEIRSKDFETDKIRSVVNKHLYELQKCKPGCLTKENIQRVLSGMGFGEAADKVESLKFGS